MKTVPDAQTVTPPDRAGPPAGMRPLSGLRIALRIAAALLGGYVFSWGFAAVVIAALSVAGLDFHEAEHAAMLLVFIVFLGAFLWAFAGRSLVLIWTVLAGGGVVMTIAAWLLQRGLLG